MNIKSENMKRIYQKLVLYIFFTLVPALYALADGPPPPPDPTGNNSGNAVGAPIDDGMFILLALGIGYGVYKIYEMRKAARKKEEAVQ